VSERDNDPAIGRPGRSPRIARIQAQQASVHKPPSVAVDLNFPFSRDSTALAAFDLITALVAVWLRANLDNVSLPVRLVASVCGLPVTLTVARIVMGIVLAPRFLAPKRPIGLNSAVYGNNLTRRLAPPDTHGHSRPDHHGSIARWRTPRSAFTQSSPKSIGRRKLRPKTLLAAR
jgi:hypothetical protein